MTDAQTKRAATVLSKYNVDNVAKLSSVQTKRQQTFASHRITLQSTQPSTLITLQGSDLETYKITKSIADHWLDVHHPRKSPKGNVLCLGLVRNNTIYCMMTFKKSRDPQYVAELSRMWTLPGYHVENGYDILSRTATELGLYNIVAYVHVPIECPDDYAAIGMRYVKQIQRTKWWILNDEILSDASRRQKHLSAEDMISNRWQPVYDDCCYMYEFT